MATAPLTIGERLGIFYAFLATFFSLVKAASVAPFRDWKTLGGGKTVKEYLIRQGIRSFMGHMSLRQQQSLLNEGTAPGTYRTFAKQHGLTSAMVAIPGGATGYWIGRPSSKKIILYFPGGGFVIPMSSGHLGFLWHVYQHLDGDVAIFVVQYNLAPGKTYPTQLRQCVEALRLCLGPLGKAPGDIVLGGDSAGGAMALGVAMHLHQKHPDIDAIALPAGASLRGVVGIAPWAEFTRTRASWARNRPRDCLPATNKGGWSDVYLAGRPVDYYNEACAAPPKWWAELRAGSVLLTAGEEECLYDCVAELAQKMAAGTAGAPPVRFYAGAGECHAAPVVERSFYAPGKYGAQTREILAWARGVFK